MLSKRVKSLEESITLAITARAKAMKAQGEKVVIMASGEPDYDTPAHIKSAAIDAINQGFTKYTATSGIEELKELISQKLKSDNKVNFTKNDLIVTVGGKQALFNIFQTLLDELDEVIVIAPYWVSYLEQIKLAGGVPVILNTKNNSFTIKELENLVSPKTKAVILNSPSNPSGYIIPEDLLKKIADLAVQKNFYVISDEVYEKFVYDGNTALSIASLNEEIKNKTIIVNAFSKTYSMTGWRIGYCAGPSDIIKAMRLVQDHQTSNVCSIAQKAAVSALKGTQKPLEEMIAEFSKRRDYMVKRLQNMNGINCQSPMGAFYTFPDISALYNDKITNSMDFCRNLLEMEKVAVVPGIGFGDDNRIRLTYSAGIDDIKEGLDRLESFIEHHCKK